jgi:hypothetical protein
VRHFAGGRSFRVNEEEASMPAKKSKKSSGAKAAQSPEVRAAHGEIKQGVKHLEKSIDEIKKGLRKTEKLIEAEAKARIRALRSDARSYLDVLKAKQRDAKTQLKKVSVAAEGSWQEVKQAADTILAEASTTATSVVDRLRAAIERP